ncbi:MAG: STING domain-containing protein [Bacteroidota bacterium]
MAKELVSDGLAVGYFYNFVKRMFDNLTLNSEIKKDEIVYPLSYDDISLDVIIPTALTESNIERCKEYVFGNNEVWLSIERGRDMSFFVKDLNINNKKVIDFPTTLGSIIEFLRIDIDNLSGFIDVDIESQEWKEREKLEIDKFKTILEFLIDSYPITQGKVTVRFLEE